MEYKDLIKNAKANGVASDKAMWQSVDGLSDMLCVLKEEHPAIIGCTNGTENQCF